MPSNKRRGPVPRRRRHDDDGEEDGSTAGDVQEYASSEGSVTSDVEDDGDVSAASVDEEAQSVPSPILEKQQPQQNADQERHFKTTAETQAMLNGLKVQDGETVEELNFDDSAESQNHPATSQPQRTSAPQSKSQFGNAERSNNQNLPPPSRGYAPHDDRFRGRGHGFPGPGTRGYVSPELAIPLY